MKRYVMDAGGSNLKELTDNAYHDGHPAWRGHLFGKPTPNQAMQPTAGRSEAAPQIMKTPPLQAMLARASGG